MSVYFSDKDNNKLDFASAPTMVAYLNVFGAGLLIGAADIGYRVGTGTCYKTNVRLITVNQTHHQFIVPVRRSYLIIFIILNIGFCSSGNHRIHCTTIVTCSVP